MSFIHGTEFIDNDTTQFNDTITRDFIDGIGEDDILIGDDGDAFFDGTGN